jgi:curved DNA-binding protein
MSLDGPFVNYYEILQVDPHCDTKTLEASYRNLAKRYHPDHPETADFEKFNQVLEAYRFVRDASRRRDYNDEYFAETAESTATGASKEFWVDERVAVNDADAHAKFLMMLYKNRRVQPLEPGVSGFMIQEMLHCSDEQFEFHRWYLKSKGLIEVTEQGALAITIEGVDHVITMSKTAMTEKLLLEQRPAPEA